MELRTIFSGSIHTYVALAVFGMTIHAQIGLAVAGGVPVAAGKVETLEQVYEKAKRLSAEPRDFQVLLGLAERYEGLS